MSEPVLELGSSGRKAYSRVGCGEVNGNRAMTGGWNMCNYEARRHDSFDDGTEDDLFSRGFLTWDNVQHLGVKTAERTG